MHGHPTRVDNMPDVSAKKLCFIVGPIDDEGTDIRAHADWVLDGIIRPVMAGYPDYQVKRADHDARPGLIGVQMINDLLDADLVIADLSYLNPNAFWEIGIRHVIGTPIIHMQLATQKIPFDVAGYRAIKFALARHMDLEKAKVDLKNFVNETMAPNYLQDNPVTNARGRLKLEQNATPETRVLMEEMDLLKSQMNDMRRILGVHDHLLLTSSDPLTASNYATGLAGRYAIPPAPAGGSYAIPPAPALGLSTGADVPQWGIWRATPLLGFGLVEEVERPAHRSCATENDEKQQIT